MMNLSADMKFSLIFVVMVIVFAMLFRELTKNMGTYSKLKAGAWLSLAGLIFSLVVTGMTIQYVQKNPGKDQKKQKSVHTMNIIYAVLLGIATLQALYLMYQLYTQSPGQVGFGF